MAGGRRADRAVLRDREMIAGPPTRAPNRDIWSLGVCLFAMLCGYPPFEDPDTNNLYKKIMAGTYKVASFLRATRAR